MSRFTPETLEAGRIYRSTGAISTKLLRKEIYRAWERSHLQGANPRAMQPEKLSTLELEQTLKQHGDFIKAVRPYGQILSQAAGKEHHVILVSDRKGILLDVSGDQQALDLKSVLQPGALLAEAVAGANGIGTPLAEGTYSEIVSGEHFIDGFYPFTCLGIPVRNEKQEILGVLNISLESPEHRQRFKEMLHCASAGVEAELILGNLKATLREVLVSHPEDYEILEKLRQDIVQAHHSARLRMDLSSRMVATARIDYAKQLLQQAEQSIEIFRHRAMFWRELAGVGNSFPTFSQQNNIMSISLAENINRLVELLSTEAAIRKIEVIPPSLEETIKITMPEKSFLRKLLRYFLIAFEKAGQGGIVKIKVKKQFLSELAEIIFIVIKKSNNSYLNPTFSTLTLRIL